MCSATVAVLTLIGVEALGMLVLGICFFMAPFFRAFPIVPGTAISAIDPLMVLATALLLPRILRGRLDISPLYVVSVFAFVIFGYTAALSSPTATATLNEVTEWFFLAVVMAIAFVSLDLSRKEVSVLAVIYIAGQMLSTVFAVIDGADPVNARYQGLAVHPNYFADGAMMSACLLLYLYHEPGARALLNRLLWWGAMAICMGAIYFSGSRGAAFGMAAVFVLVPLVERSGAYAFLGALAIVSGLLVLQPLADRSAEGSTLARLTGSDGTGNLTQQFRLDEWNDALGRLAQHPVWGEGLTLEVLSFHNNYLSLAVGVGLLAATAYLVVLWSMVRGLFGPSAERRLLYPVIAFAAWGLTQPGFKDRSNWVPMLLGLAVFHGYRTARAWHGTRVDAETPTEPTLGPGDRRDPVEPTLGTPHDDR